MSQYSEYLKEIEERKGQGLHPKPIDGAELLSEIITQIIPYQVQLLLPV
jgi:aconitate hydratase 2/2-methylisocitrate dehydratase